MTQPLGVKFEYEGGATPIQIAVSSHIKNVQIDCQGFDIEDATVKVLPTGSDTWKTVAFEAGSGPTGYIKDVALRRVEVGGLDAGSYFITVTQ